MSSLHLFTLCAVFVTGTLRWYHKLAPASYVSVLSLNGLVTKGQSASSSQSEFSVAMVSLSNILSNITECHHYINLRMYYECYYGVCAVHMFEFRQLC